MERGQPRPPLFHDVTLLSSGRQLAGYDDRSDYSGNVFFFFADLNQSTHPPISRFLQAGLEKA